MTDPLERLREAVANSDQFGDVMTLEEWLEKAGNSSAMVVQNFETGETTVYTSEGSTSFPNDDDDSDWAS